MPAPGPEPMCGSATAASSTHGSAGNRVSSQAHCPHRYPIHSAASFTPLRRFARLRHRQCPAVRPLTAYAWPHPARCTGIGYRRSSSTRSRRSESTMLIQRMPRNAVAHLGTLADFALLGLHCFHCTAQCAHFVRGYRRCSPWTHSCRCRRSTLPCLRFHRTSTSPKHKIPAKSRFRRDFVARKKQRY